MQIIPAIDIIDGKCVRLSQGDYDRQTTYHDQPLEVARRFEAAGLTRLHLVDLDGAKQKAVKNWKVLEEIASQTSLSIDFGGGVNSREDVEKVLSSGAGWVTVGSIAVRDPDELESWFEHFGAEKFMLGADVRDRKIAIHGWLETTALHVIDFIATYVAKGVQQVFCTDVSKDGQLQGPSLELYQEIREQFPSLSFIASGGVSSVDDLERLREIGCSGAIVGKAIYENRITLEQLKELI